MWMIDKILELKEDLEELEHNLIGIECKYQGLDAMIHNVNIRDEYVTLIIYEYDSENHWFVDFTFEEFKSEIK